MRRPGVGKLGPTRALPITKLYSSNRCSRYFKLEYTDHGTTSSGGERSRTARGRRRLARPGYASESCWKSWPPPCASPADQAIGVIDALPDPHSPRAQVVRSRATALGAVSQSAPRDVTRIQDGPLDALVEAWIDRAYGHLGGQVTLAVPAVRQALQLAEPERMRRPFMDSTPQLRGCCASTATLSAAGQLAGSPAASKVVTPRPTSAARTDPRSAVA